MKNIIYFLFPIIQMWRNIETESNDDVQFEITDSETIDNGLKKIEINI
jgi:hypothetical protein